MLIYKEQAENLIKNLKANLIGELEGKAEFLFSLLNDDDWSLVIKSHALIETIITDLIISKIEDEKIKDIIDRLPLYDNQIGKLKIIKTYELLSDEQIAFVRKLSELRNNLVHKFENIEFKFSTYVQSLDKNQKKSWKKTFTWYENDSESQKVWEKILIENTKLGIWFSIFMFVSLSIVSIQEVKGQTLINNVSSETTKKIVKCLV